MPTQKAAATGGKILDAALELFRTRGYDATTMREIAAKAGVATGAAYYYFPSKDALVMAFYQRTFDEMQPKIRKVLETPGSLEARMRVLFRVYIEKYGADRSHPVSPFSKQTKKLREMEIGWFRTIFSESGLRVPAGLELRMPEV